MPNTEALINLGLKLQQGVPKEVLKQAITDNPIFTEESIRFAIEAVASKMFDKKTLSYYTDKSIKGKKIAIIMAGNIPLVGIADLICVVLLDGTPLVKPSSKDKALMDWVIGLFRENGISVESFDDNSLPDAVIATGSDATNVIFKQKYGHLPLLVRGSRTSVAMLSKTPSIEDMKNLWTDVFQHASLGCRNVSHLFLKKEVEIAALLEAWRSISCNNEYIINNYRSKKAILEMTGKSFIDCGYALLRESVSFNASLGEITYSYYENDHELQSLLSENANTIQCIVGEGEIPFGQAQRPAFNDWADGIDTVEFLMRTVDRA